MALILSVLARLGLSERLQKPVAWITLAILLMAVLSLGKCAYDRSVIDAHDNETAAKVERAARKGDGAARSASDTIRNETEVSNDEARNAAAGSDDPLKSGLDSLRNR